MANDILNSSTAGIRALVLTGALLAVPGACTSYSDYETSHGLADAGPDPTKPDARDAGDGGTHRSPGVDADGVQDAGGARDTGPAEETGAVTDAGSDGPPVPIPCGKTVTGRRTHIDFSCADVLYDFDRFTPTPYDPGPGFWGFVPVGDGGLLFSSGNVRAFPSGKNDAGAWKPPEYGTFAIYEPLDITDGSFSVHLTSPDPIATIAFHVRYRDVAHSVYLAMVYRATGQGTFAVGRRDDPSGFLIGSGNLPPGSWENPGHRVELKFVGNDFTPYVDGASLGVFHGDGVVSSGKVGLEVLTLDNGQFDDFDIVDLSSNDGG